MERNKTVKDFTCGELHSLAVCNSGEVYAWGAGEFGQLGNNSRYDRSLPERVKFSEDLKVQKLDAGKNHSVILTDQGFLYSFGEDNLGQLGLRRKKKIVEVPTIVSYMTHKTVSNVACGTFHTVILIDPYYVFTTGNNKFGQLGLGETSDKSTFTFVKKLSHKNVIDVFAGDHHSWFLLDHDEPFIDDYELPEPWRFSERSISDDNDFKEGRIRKKKKKRDDQATVNQFVETGERRLPDTNKKRRPPRDLDLDLDEEDSPRRPKRDQMKYFDDQAKEGDSPHEYADLQDSNEWEEDSGELIESDEDPHNDNFFNEENPTDMGQKNFYPNKKTYERISKENSRVEDSGAHGGSKRSLGVNMLGDPAPKKDFSMKPNMLGGQQQSHLDVPGTSRMLPKTNSQDQMAIGQNNSMRMDNRRKLDMKPATGLNMMGTREGYNEKGIFSSGNQQMTGEKEEDGLDSELMSEKDSEIGSGEDPGRLEYNTRQVYPDPNVVNQKVKRRTVDNPMTMQNDLVNTFKMVNEEQLPPGKRHQSQANKNQRRNLYSQNDIEKRSIEQVDSGFSDPDEDYQGGLDSAGGFGYQKSNQGGNRPNMKGPNQREEEEYSEDEEEGDWRRGDRKKKRKKRPREYSEEESEEDLVRRKKRRKNKKERGESDEEDEPRGRGEYQRRNDQADGNQEPGGNRDDQGRPDRDSAGFFNQQQFHAGNVPEGMHVQRPIDDRRENSGNDNEGGNTAHDQKLVYNTYNTYNTYNIDRNQRYQGPGGVARQNQEGGAPVDRENGERQVNEEEDLMRLESRDGESDTEDNGQRKKRDRNPPGESQGEAQREEGHRQRGHSGEGGGGQPRQQSQMGQLGGGEYQAQDLANEEQEYELDESGDDANGENRKNWNGQQPPKVPQKRERDQNSPETPGQPKTGLSNQHEFEYPNEEQGEGDPRDRGYSTGLNIIKEEEDYPSSAQTNPRQSRQKMFEEGSTRKEKTQGSRGRGRNRNRGRQRGNRNVRTVKVHREERVEEIGQPESELVFQVMDERIERERVEVRKRRVLTCASRVVLTDNKRSHRFVVMRILKADNAQIKERIGQYIDLLGEEDPGMEYYNVTDFDNVFRQAQQFQLERVEDLGEYTSLTLMMIHNMAEYGGLVGGDIRQVDEEYRQIRSQLTTIGEMYIFTDEELSSRRKWQRLSQWVHLFKDMFRDQIHGMSVLELRPKEFK